MLAPDLLLESAAGEPHEWAEKPQAAARLELPRQWMTVPSGFEAMSSSPRTSMPVEWMAQIRWPGGNRRGRW